VLEAEVNLELSRGNLYNFSSYVGFFFFQLALTVREGFALPKENFSPK
jgi:hypothetical protein